MTHRELPDTFTPLDIPSLWKAMLLAWEPSTAGCEPTKAAVELKLAQIHLETNLKSCHCWNLGNVKSHPRDGQCWTFFACGEEIKASQLHSVEAMAPGLVKVKATYQKLGEPWVSIKVLPKHPWSRFAAFEDLTSAVAFQLAYLKRHASVRDAMLTGDAAKFAHALALAHYHTAAESTYRKGLLARLAVVRKALEGVDWGDVT